MTTAHRILHTAKTEVVYATPRFRDITRAEVSRHFAGESRTLTAIYRPTEIVASDLEDMRRELSSGYFVQLGFMARRCDLIFRSPRPAQVDALRLVPFASLQELQEATTNTVEEHFFTPWESYLGSSMTAQMRHDLMSNLNPDNAMSVFYGAQRVALVTLFPDFDCLGKPLEQISWIWANHTLSVDLRRSAHFLLVEWLRGRTADWFQAGVHLLNLPSQHYFSRLGFQPTCAHIFQK